MAERKLHDGEVDIDGDLVRRLVATQFPDWAGLPLRPFPSTGTVNAIYRLGDDMYVRLPRVRPWAADVEKELRWLPVLGPQLPLEVPEPLGAGRPTDDYPLPWAVFRWLPGVPLETEGTRADGDAGNGRDDRDDRAMAADLARFVTALRRIDMAGAPGSTRDRPLAERDDEVQGALAVLRGRLRGTIDTDAAAAAWEAALRAPAWDGSPTWTHGDLLPPNLLVDSGGRLAAVLDWGNVGVGDPAVDVVAAWSVLGPAGRTALRGALDVDDGTWHRARGLALRQALMIIPYYRDTNPPFATMAMRTVDQVLADHALDR